MNSSGNGELLLVAGYVLKQTKMIMALNHYSLGIFNLTFLCALVFVLYMNKRCSEVLSCELLCGIVGHLLLRGGGGNGY